MDGKEVKIPQTRLWLYHKEAGVLVTHDKQHANQQGRKTIWQLLEKYNLPNTISVGRLDLNTEGLILLTNDGSLARYLELPSSRIERTYNVKVFGKVTSDKLESLRNGIYVNGEKKYSGMHCKILSEKGRNVWLSISLFEGKNRQIRQALHYLHLKIARIIRVKFGQWSLHEVVHMASLKEVKLSKAFLNQLTPPSQPSSSAAPPVSPVPNNIKQTDDVEDLRNSKKRYKTNTPNPVPIKNKR